MAEPRMDRVFAGAKNAVALVANKPIPETEIRDEVQRILQDKNVLALVREGRISKEDGTNLVLAGLESWAILRSSLPQPVQRKWDLSFIAEDMQSDLFGD
jgi:hypothetical protein